MIVQRENYEAGLVVSLIGSVLAVMKQIQSESKMIQPSRIAERDERRSSEF